MKPKLTWMKHLHDKGTREYVALEVAAMRDVELAMQKLETLRKHAQDQAKRYHTPLEIRKAKMGQGSQ